MPWPMHDRCVVHPSHCALLASGPPGQEHRLPGRGRSSSRVRACMHTCGAVRQHYRPAGTLPAVGARRDYNLRHVVANYISIATPHAGALPASMVNFVIERLVNAARDKVRCSCTSALQACSAQHAVQIAC